MFTNSPGIFRPNVDGSPSLDQYLVFDGVMLRTVKGSNISSSSGGITVTFDIPEAVPDDLTFAIPFRLNLMDGVDLIVEETVLPNVGDLLLLVTIPKSTWDVMKATGTWGYNIQRLIVNTTGAAIALYALVGQTTGPGTVSFKIGTIPYSELNKTPQLPGVVYELLVYNSEGSGSSTRDAVARNMASLAASAAANADATANEAIDVANEATKTLGSFSRIYVSR